jgi:LacI family transcriptional regulator
MKKMITMSDIAKKVGVSRPTVSFVLNGLAKEEKINLNTVRRIKNAAVTLGYRRNELARAMVTGKSFVLGFLAGDVESEFAGKILAGAIGEADRHQYLIKHLSAWHVTPEEIVNRCIEQRLAGLICHSRNENILNKLHDGLSLFGIPIGIVDSSFEHDWGIRVTTDDFYGTFLAIEHLYKLGHRRISYISSQPSHCFAENRKNAYIKAMESFGLRVSDDMIVFGAEIDDIDGVVRRVFNGTCPLPTALFCSSDFIAMVAKRALRAINLAVPIDVSIIGFADLQLTEYSDPPLTTIHQPAAEMGRIVTRKMIERINTGTIGAYDDPVEELVNVRLIVRESTASPRT